MFLNLLESIYEDLEATLIFFCFVFLSVAVLKWDIAALILEYKIAVHQFCLELENQASINSVKLASDSLKGVLAASIVLSI